MTTQMEQIQAREKELGRPLSPVERMAFAAPGKRLGDADAKDFSIIFQETKEGLNLHAEMQRRKKLVENVADSNERFKLAHWFANQKQLLLRQFKRNELTRLPPKTE